MWRTRSMFLQITSQRSSSWIPAYALLDSGATHVLLPGHMLPEGARSFEVTVNLAVGKEKAKCWRNEVYAQERAHPLLPLGRLTNLLDTKFVWENGTAVMQCRDNGKWRTMTKFEIRNNMACGRAHPQPLQQRVPAPMVLTSLPKTTSQEAKQPMCLVPGLELLLPGLELAAVGSPQISPGLVLAFSWP